MLGTMVNCSVEVSYSNTLQCSHFFVQVFEGSKSMMKLLFLSPHCVYVVPELYTANNTTLTTYQN